MYEKYETSSEMSRGLAPETRQRIREVFGGQACVTCAAPAARLYGGQFYCPDHFPRRPAAESRQPRVYRCAIALPG